MTLFTTNPARRAAELLIHLRGENCAHSREAAECVRRVMIELRGAIPREQPDPGDG